MRNIKVLGIDLAKNVFQLHGTDAKGKQILRKRFNRMQLIEFVSNLSPCIIGIEACTGAHYWGRLFERYGHTVKMMAPQFVKPYIKSNKSDRNDARGIAEAVTRPDMKFVPIKMIEQQETLLLHRARELVVKQRTAQANQIRGCLLEFGVVIPQGVTQIRKLPIILEDNADKLTAKAKEVFLELYEQFITYDLQEKKYQRQIERQANQDVMCQEIMKIEGVGPLIASATVATIGDAKLFKNGREVAAWLGLVPKQHSSGNKVRLLGISKRGDHYVRKLLIQGARSAVKNCEKKTDMKNKWIADKKQRCGFNKAAVALANKNARIIWAVMVTGECYRPSI
ncbi:MAG TPA: IS110 family transposase [Gammaproteobacteria bacterium]|nr:IS110 family transposase [Gammaproteobacteria bacterium]